MKYRDWTIFNRSREDTEVVWFASLGEELIMDSSLVNVMNVIDELEDGYESFSSSEWSVDNPRAD